MAESADAWDLKSLGRKLVRVQVSLPVCAFESRYKLVKLSSFERKLEKFSGDSDARINPCFYLRVFLDAAEERKTILSCLVCAVEHTDNKRFNFKDSE